MRPGLFDESKIIKKEDIKEEKTPELKKGEEIVEQQPIHIINKNDIAKLEIENNDISTKINNNEEQPNIEKQKIVNSQPVFIFERDKETKKVRTVGSIQNKTIDLDVSNDYLSLIYSNTIRQINEIKVDIEVLKLLITEKDNFYFQDKLTQLIQELEFNNKKLEILEKLIK